MKGNLQNSGAQGCMERLSALFMLVVQLLFCRSGLIIVKASVRFRTGLPGVELQAFPFAQYILDKNAWSGVHAYERADNSFWEYRQHKMQ